MTEFANPPKTTVRRGFFVPGADESVADSLEAWQAYAAKAVGGSTDRKVQRLVYRHNGEVLISEVGYREHDGTAAWLVTAILEPHGTASPWNIIIVGIRNGELVVRNPPILVSHTDVIEILDFRVPVPAAGNGEDGGHETASEGS